MNTRRWAALASAMSLPVLLLGGCATGSMQRPAAALPASVLAPPAATVPAPIEIEAAAAKAPETPDFWQGLRASFVLGGCDGDRLVGKWIRTLSEHPRRFQAQMRRDLPMLRVVAQMAMERHVPGEFALLPWVESNFRALPGRGNRPAGMWQIMPATGRALGLRIGAKYDGRLDLHESSASALKLLNQHYQTLGDWRLADMAYNTGLYRIKRLMQEDPDAALEQPIPDLAVSATTRNHLAKLSALGCIVRDPARHGIHLPRVVHAYRLVRVELAQALDLRVAAHLAGMPLARLRELNPAYLDLSAPALELSLPYSNAKRLASADAELAAWGWGDWRCVRVRSPATFEAMVAGDPAQAELLATVNGRTTAVQLGTTTTLWLPGSILAGSRKGMQALPAGPESHRVQAGDTLWDLARRFRVSVVELRLWNQLDTDLLHLGQVLRLSPPLID